MLQGDFLCFFFFYFGCCQFHGSQAFANDLLDLNINISIYIYISLFFLIALSASSYLYLYAVLFFFVPPQTTSSCRFFFFYLFMYFFFFPFYFSAFYSYPCTLFSPLSLFFFSHSDLTVPFYALLYFSRCIR